MDSILHISGSLIQKGANPLLNLDRTQAESDPNEYETYCYINDRTYIHAILLQKLDDFQMESDVGSERRESRLHIGECIDIHVKAAGCKGRFRFWG